MNPQDPFRFHLDSKSGVPFYRQILEAVLCAVAEERLAPGERLPTTRQVAVDLSVNPNTVVRAYRELEIRGILRTQQGVGTFVADRKPRRDEVERERRLDALLGEFLARAGGLGFTAVELARALADRTGGLDPSEGGLPREGETGRP